MASDSLLRVIQARMPTTRLIIFADDAAALLTSWREQLKGPRRIMTTYSNITTMDINTTENIRYPPM